MASLASYHSLSCLVRVRTTYAPMSGQLSPSSSYLPLTTLGSSVRSPPLQNGRFAMHFEAATRSRMRRLQSVAGEIETLAPEEQGAVELATPSEQPVSVSVSPSDTLTMFFQAEGTINEAAIPTVTKALEGKEGVGNLKVQLSEGIASVELTQQTTVQATGVASSLVETIQGSGFKLQSLNLSFAEEEDVVN